MFVKIVSAFIEFPGLIVTLLLMLGIYKRKKSLLFLSILFYLISSEFVWLPVQNLWTVIEFPVNGDTVILGGGALKVPEGTQLSRATTMRLIKGYQVWKKYGGKIIVCGGKTPSGVVEAVLMKDLLMQFGVPEDSIVVENESLNTLENLKNAVKFIKGKVNIVTSALHTRRVKLIAKKFKINSSVVASDYLLESRVTYRSFLPSSDSLKFISYLTHEIFGIIYYKLIGGI